MGADAVIYALCIKCNGPMDLKAIESKKKVAAALYPGRQVPPPRVCTTCLWRTLQKLVDEGGAP